jgi:hypothetical protein
VLGCIEKCRLRMFRKALDYLPVLVDPYLFILALTPAALEPIARRIQWMQYITVVGEAYARLYTNMDRYRLFLRHLTKLGGC